MKDKQKSHGFPVSLLSSVKKKEKAGKTKDMSSEAFKVPGSKFNIGQKVKCKVANSFF